MLVPTMWDTKVHDEMDIRSYLVGRIENYSDSVIREAIAYGIKESELLVWYHFEDMKRTFVKFVFPDVSKWENTKTWKIEYKSDPITRTRKRGNLRGYARGNYPDVKGGRHFCPM